MSFHKDNMNVNDSSEEKNANDGRQEINNLAGVNNLTIRQALQINHIVRMQAETRQQQTQENQQLNHHTIQRLQEDERQRLVLELLQRQQREAQLLRLQQQYGQIGNDQLFDTRNQVSTLSPSTLIQLHLEQEQRNQQQLQQQVQQDQLQRLQLQRLQLQRLVLQQQALREEEQVRETLQQISQQRIHNPALLQNASGLELNSAHSAGSRIDTMPIIRNLGTTANIETTNICANDRTGLQSAGIGGTHFNLNRNNNVESSANIAHTASSRSGIDMSVLQSVGLRSVDINASRNIDNMYASLPMRRDVGVADNMAATDTSGNRQTRIEEESFHPEGDKIAAANDVKSDKNSEAAVFQPWSATSAKVMQNMQMSDGTSGVASAKKTSTLRKKILGMPKRPLHAYNIFFQEERQRILSELPSPPKDDEAYIYVLDGKRKRRRRATHGKISFASLAKSIGEKWKAIDDQQRVHYQQLAGRDLQRYHDEMDAYNTKMKDKEMQKQTLPVEGKAKNDAEEDKAEIEDGNAVDEDGNDEEGSSIESNEALGYYKKQHEL